MWSSNFLLLKGKHLDFTFSKDIFVYWNQGESWLLVFERAWEARWNEMEWAYPGSWWHLLHLRMGERRQRRHKWLPQVTESVAGWRPESFPPCVSLQIFEESLHTFSYPFLKKLKVRLIFCDSNSHLILEFSQYSHQVFKLESFRVWKLFLWVLTRPLPILITFPSSQPFSVGCSGKMTGELESLAD